MVDESQLLAALTDLELINKIFDSINMNTRCSEDPLFEPLIKR